MKSHQNHVYEAIGRASMCWNPAPPDEVFDSDEATRVGRMLIDNLLNDKGLAIDMLAKHLNGLHEYINNSYDFVDGDWYWKIDIEGDCKLSIEDVIKNFLNK